MKYEDLILYLNDQHFYPSKEIKLFKKTEKIIGLQVASSPIMMESKMKKLQEILIGRNVAIQKMPNESYILLTINKSK